MEFTITLNDIVELVRVQVEKRINREDLQMYKVVQQHTCKLERVVSGQNSSNDMFGPQYVYRGESSLDNIIRFTPAIEYDREMYLNTRVVFRLAGNLSTLTKNPDMFEIKINRDCIKVITTLELPEVKVLLLRLKTLRELYDESSGILFGKFNLRDTVRRFIGTTDKSELTDYIVDYVINKIYRIGGGINE